jgi:molybdopterin-guanine dinucleotide biosynthesis protein A
VEGCAGSRDRGLLVAILAGGDGRRIGGGKPLRVLGGSSLFERALVAASDWSTDIVAVGRDPGQIGSIAIPFLLDAPGAEGPIAGLAAALSHARRRRLGLVLTIPCDTPFLPAELAERLRASLEPNVDAAVAASGGLLHPCCALWRTRAFDALGPYLASGGRSLRGFAHEAAFAQVEWPLDAQDPFFNINSPADLAAAEDRFRVHNRVG